MKHAFRLSRASAAVVALAAVFLAAAAPARGGHARAADQLVDQVLIPLVRPVSPGVLPRHGPSLGTPCDKRHRS